MYLHTKVIKFLKLYAIAYKIDYFIKTICN